MKKTILILSGIFAVANVVTAQAQVPDILGTWVGTYMDAGLSTSNPIDFVVQNESFTSPTSDAISGIFQFPGATQQCATNPCQSTWTGTVSNGAITVNVTGQFDQTYEASLTNGNTLSGLFQPGPDCTKNCDSGSWTVTAAPEISSASAASALTLLVGGLLVMTGRNRRNAPRTQLA